MLKNYLLIAFRNMVNSPALSLIKVAGLSVGVCGCVVIFLIARYEMSFDRVHPDGDRIYRVYTSFTGIWTGENGGVPIPVADYIRDNCTGIETVAQFFTWSGDVAAIRASGDKYELDRYKNIAIVDSRYFDIFSSYEWIAGTPDVLEQPNHVVLTSEQADRYFGFTDVNAVLGKHILYRDSIEVTVAGIIKPLEGNTDLHFSDFISLPTTKTNQLKNEFQGEWGSTNSNTQCFVKALPATPASLLEEQMAAVKKARDEGSKSDGPETTATWFNLQPLSEMHFSSFGIFDSSRTPSSLSTIKALIGLAALLLVIACINFVNLETAQGVRRSKEVGLRKVMGGTRRSLVAHFLTESVLITTVAVAIAVPMVWLSMKVFSEFIPEGLVFKLADPQLFVFLAAVIAVVGALSGIYPAVVLSSFQPAVALRNKMRGGQSRSSILRKVLTVFQFSFSQVLIAGALIVSLQISYMINKDLGFTADEVVTISTPWYEKRAKRNVLRNELSQISGITDVTLHGRAPVARGNSSTTFTYKSGADEIHESVYMFYGDTSYLSLFSIPIIAGRNVIPADSLKEILINRTFCEKLGEEVVDMPGKQIKGNGEEWTVVGVVDDFHFKSLHEKVEPMFFYSSPSGSQFSMRLVSQENTQATIEEIRKAARKIFPDYDPNPIFIDDTIQKFYEQETRTAKLANTATGLAIFISCLGLFALASFTAIQRTKEIGVRKVLGASVRSIVVLLSKEFLLLVAIAFLIAAPLSWYVSQQWLDKFAYRMDVGVWIFAVAGIASVVVAFITVGYQALRAAVVNPVESLRYE